MEHNPITFELCEGEPDERHRIVDTGLDEFNASVAPLEQVRSLSVFARNSANEIVGGVVGRTWGACAELQQLWVKEEDRRRGVGTRLLSEWEAAAARRDCRTSYLETFSFQAPAFYREHGYEVSLTIAGYAPGLSRHTMLKSLKAAVH